MPDVWWSVAAAGLWTLAIAVRVRNAFLFPLDGTADARLGHLDYIRWVHTHWAQPPTHQNWETWQPPLFYWASAALWKAVEPFSARPDDLLAPPQAVLLPLFTSALGLLAVWVGMRVTRRLVPGDRLAHTLALALLLFLPMHLMLAPWLRNDLVVVLLTSLVLARLAATPDLGAMSGGGALALGVLGGLALLAKYTGTAVVAVCGLTFGIVALVRPARAAWAAATFAVVAGIAFVMSAWFYAWHWLAYGSAFVTPNDWFGGFRLPPGSRTLADWLWFAPEVFVRPWVLDPDVIHSIPAGTYASTWFDAQYIFLVHWMPQDVAVWPGRWLLLLGVLPTFVLLAGAARALAAVVRDGLEPWLPLVVCAVWAVVAYVVLNVGAPFYSTVKGHYLMPAALPCMAFFALGVARAPGWLRAALAVDVGLLVVSASVVFCFGLIGGR
jgi:hypothetical protein